MSGLIDKKVLVTGVLILVIVFFLRKAFVKVFPQKDGSVLEMAGFDGVGYV